MISVGKSCVFYDEMISQCVLRCKYLVHFDDGGELGIYLYYPRKSPFIAQQLFWCQKKRD